jgi:hypothetical protein
MATSRQYFHYEDLEEFTAGMWRIVRGSMRIRNAAASADLMRHPENFKVAMYRAVKEWPKSCLHNLTAEAVNRIAWLGHAGCCLGVGSPEENTRIGWHMLTAAEQMAANAAAMEVLNYWESVHNQDAQLELFGC